MSFTHPSPQGDQGGPLICPGYGSGKYLLVGALSGGVECGAVGVPDVFSSYLGPVQKWARGVVVQRFGTLEDPASKSSSDANSPDVDVGKTAGSFYYDDGLCHGYEPKTLTVRFAALKK